MNLMTDEKGLCCMFQNGRDYQLLNIPGDTFAAAVLKMNEALDESIFLKMLSYVNIVKSSINNGCYEIVILNDVFEVVVIFGFSKKTRNKINILTNVIERLITYLEGSTYKKNFTNITAGIGLFYSSITQIDKSYLQAQKALEKCFFRNDQNLFIFDKSGDINPTYERQWIKEFFDDANLIVSAALSGNIEKVEVLIKILIKQFVNEKLSPKFIKNYCYVLIFLLNTNLSKYKDQLDISDILQNDYENEIKNNNSLQNLQKFIIHIFKNAAQQMHTLYESKQWFNNKIKIIDFAKKYINENYYKDLSLVDLSKHVFLSPVYLSSLFKNITGENYIDYLKKVRLEKAKELLKKVELKVYEVGNMVGYDDYKYFTIQFKKTYGISPTKYRREAI